MDNYLIIQLQMDEGSLNNVSSTPKSNVGKFDERLERLSST